jgi:hypothetical protein
MRQILTRSLVAFGSLITLTSVAPSAHAAPASATAPACATVVTPIAIKNVRGLAFGSFAPGSIPGTVTVEPNGLRTTSGGEGPSLVTSTVTAASFIVTGTPNANYTITLPTLATLTGPGPAMPLTDFTSDPTSPGTLNGNGRQTVNVGATLTVGPSSTQTTGVYSGTFTVTVDYF